MVPHVDRPVWLCKAPPTIPSALYGSVIPCRFSRQQSVEREKEAGDRLFVPYNIYDQSAFSQFLLALHKAIVYSRPHR
jgi:hypothetical protein